MYLSSLTFPPPPSLVASALSVLGSLRAHPQGQVVAETALFLTVRICICNNNTEATARGG